jgi:hypothetical protein
MYVIIFYVPEQDATKVKSALFAAGAGKIGNYDCCAWQCSGIGQFRPLQESHPHIGLIGAVEKVNESRIEMVCADEIVRSVVEALIQAHPYEEPAYHLLKALTIVDFK